jgi:nucleotide-binding universal stress UspA family protein
MTVVVGWPPRRGGAPAALELAAAMAVARGEDLLAVAVVPPRWNVPAMARADAQFEDWARGQGESARAEIDALLAARGHGTAMATAVGHRAVSDRSVPGALIRAAEEAAASVVVIGSSEDARRGRIELGSTGDRLLHSAATPVAIAPRGYVAPRSGFTRVTCAVAGLATDAGLVATATELASAAGVPLRLVTFAVRLDTMYPTEVGYAAEDDIARAVADQADESIRALRNGGLVPDDVEAVVAQGSGWRAAVEAVDWADGDLMVVGSHPMGPLARVFLGSSATKIVRHSPVPVLVAPAQ